MDALWFWIILLLLLITIALFPRWPHMRGRNWGYGPSVVALGVLLLVLILFWFGAIAILWPWTYSGAPEDLSWRGPSFWAGLSAPR